MDLQAQFDQLADGMAERGYAWVDSFLSPEEVFALLERLKELKANGEMAKAGIGKGGEYQRNSQVRGDQIRWIDPEEAASPTKHFLDKMEALMELFNRHCFIGVRDYEAHFAVYPPGAFYKRHLDQFQRNINRRYTFLLYLNMEWQPGDGGELRMYLPSAEGEQSLDVAPLGGRFLMFESGKIEHEVLPTHKLRYSLTGWWLDQDKELAFLL